MIPKYAIPAVDSELLKQCIGKTLEKTKLAVLDWKGIKGEHKAPLLETLKHAGIPFEKV
jgi:D-tyrosyl-tRNA(Tyr) deacylase